VSVAGPAIVILWEPPAARHGPGCRGCLQLSIVTGVTTANVAPGEDEAHAPRLHSMGGQIYRISPFKPGTAAWSP